ncbi:MAG: hypothetical protein ACK40V_00445 [Anaerolineales bacterium]
MNNKNTGLIATIAAVVLCGCPGLLAVFYGGLMSVISFIPGADINIQGSSDPSVALGTGLGSCCVGLLFVAIPIAVWYFTMRKKPEAIESTPPAE